jgi:hypothetical protein
MGWRLVLEVDRRLLEFASRGLGRGCLRDPELVQPSKITARDVKLKE